MCTQFVHERSRAAAITFIAAASGVSVHPAQADGEPQKAVAAAPSPAAAGAPPLPPPVGVPFAGMTPEGKTVVAYVRRWLTFDGLISGTKSVSPEWVVLNRPYRFPPPAQLRRMPIHATTSIDALSLAHGITDRVSLIVTGTYIQQDTTGLTFAGLSGTTRLGTAPDPLDELGDSRVGANFKLYQEGGQTVIGSLGVFIPTGSQKMGNPVLTPSGAIVYSRARIPTRQGQGLMTCHWG